MKFLQIAKELLSQKSLKIIVPGLVALIVGVAGVVGVAIDSANLTNIIMLVAGLAGTIIGLFANPDKPVDDGSNDTQGGEDGGV